MQEPGPHRGSILDKGGYRMSAMLGLVLNRAFIHAPTDALTRALMQARTHTHVCNCARRCGSALYAWGCKRAWACLFDHLGCYCQHPLSRRPLHILQHAADFPFQPSQQPFFFIVWPGGQPPPSKAT